MKTMTTIELQQRLQAGPVALFDIRGDIEFEKGHIPGASTAPLGSLNFRVAGVMNPQSLVVVYSASSDDGLASEAVERLENLRLRNVVCYADGVTGWLRAGHQLVASKCPKDQGWGPVTDCRPIVVDTERAYGGAFKHKSIDVAGAGG